MHIVHATYDNTLDLLSNDFEEYVLSTDNAFFLSVSQYTFQETSWRTGKDWVYRKVQNVKNGSNKDTK